MASQTRIAPGPRGWPLLGNLLAFRRDVLQLLLDSQRTLGDVVRFRLGPLIVHLLSHPEHVKHVLLTNQHNYNKDTRSSAKIRGITGEGLLTGSGELWLQQRRLMQPAFQSQRLVGLTDLMTTAVATRLKAWESYATRGQPLDIASEMMRITYTIVGNALFSTDVTHEIGGVEHAVAKVLAHTYHRLETLLDLPLSWPTLRNLRFRRALKKIDAVVYRIIDERMSGSKDPGDLLSILLRRDEESGACLSPQQIRNETITLLLSGHETTANALTWTWYLLGQHPLVEHRVRQEVEAVLAQRVPRSEDLASLKYTTMVIREAMRLYPPIWVMERHVLDEDRIDGYRIPAGSTVVLSPYVTHRHLGFWDEPEKFDPERFLPERVGQRAQYAYIPFGAGQRLCIGNSFALMEAQLIVAMVLQAYRLDLVPGIPVEPLPGITLRSRNGLMVRVCTRR